MIPILYEKNETSFTSNGIGRLTDLIECTVTEERNGEFVLSAIMLVSSRLYAEVKKDRIIFAEAHDGDDGQPFRIESISTPLDGKVEIEAVHISYQLSWIPLIPFTAANCAEAMTKISQKSTTTNPFTFWTDINTVAEFKLETPASVRSILGGIRGSVLDVYGGEYEFDKYTVKLHSQRGVDNGVELRYGKNITDIKQEESIANTYTGILPYWQNEDTLVTVDGYIVNSQYYNAYAFNRVLVVDFSTDFDSAPTKAQLLSKAQSYINSNNIGVPKVSIDVSFIALWQTEEYKHIANLERVKLCDSVKVYFEKLGIEAKAKVVKTVYDVLRDRYTEITIGTIDASLAKTISDISTEIKQSAEDTKSAYQKAIDNATSQITGAKGGVIQIHYDANDKPVEMTIANNENLANATKVWRWNIGGLGYSKDGYDGPYTTAITQDGAIVADFITTGTLDASKATITNLDASNINTGTIKNKSNNNSYWNLVTGEFKTTNGTFVNCTIETSDNSGYFMNLKEGYIYGGKSSTEYGRIDFGHSINNTPALGIKGDKISIRGQIYTATDKNASTVYQGATKTFNNVVSGLSFHSYRYNNMMSNLDVEWAAWENIVRDLSINFSTRQANWTISTIEIPDTFNWDKTSFDALADASWTNNTMVFRNGLLT